MSGHIPTAMSPLLSAFGKQSCISDRHQPPGMDYFLVFLLFCGNTGGDTQDTRGSITSSCDIISPLSTVYILICDSWSGLFPTDGSFP